MGTPATVKRQDLGVKPKQTSGLNAALRGAFFFGGGSKKIGYILRAGKYPKISMTLEHYACKE